MVTEDKIRYENYNIILIKKKQKYRDHQQVKLMNTNILQGKKFYL